MTSFDYIVVGAGSAGAVVAARLSESAGNKGLLIEAGGSHKHMNVQVRSGDAAPDMQYLCAPGYFYDHGFRTYPAPALGLGCSLVGPRSTVRIRLRSSDPKDTPAITANYLKEPEDMQAMITAVERAREIFASAPLRGLVDKEIHPGGDTSSREALATIIRREAEHTYHPACTARIGTESSGVVDPELRVHGVQRLRAAGASVFPTIPHGNTHAPTVMAGEKAAIMIATAG